VVEGFVEKAELYI